MRNSLEKIFQMGTSDMGLDTEAYLTNDAYRESEKVTHNLDEGIKMYEDRGGGSGVLDKPTTANIDWESVAMLERMSGLTPQAGGGGGDNGSGIGGGGSGGGGSDSNDNGDDDFFKKDSRTMSVDQKFASIGSFANLALERLMPEEKLIEMKENPISMMSNIMQIRNYIQSSSFGYNIAYDLNTKQVLFYTYGDLVGNELIEKVQDL